MARRLYVTREGDMLDLVCYRHFDGRQAGAVEAVLEANQRINLSHYGPRLPRGLTIVLPELPKAVTQAPLQTLWD